MVKKVVIVGAGPSGVLLAHYLLRRDDKYQIDIYERRSDPRIIEFSKSRTFPMTLNERGMSALRKISGVEEAVKAISVEITGSFTHQTNGKTRFRRRSQPLFAVDRTNLAIALLQTLIEKYDNSRFNIHFDCKCSQLDFAAKTARFETEVEEFTVDYDLLIGADGARSAVREAFLTTEGFECEQKYIHNDYKSIFLPANNHLKPGYVHAWQMQDGSAVLLLHKQDGTMIGAMRFPHKKNKIAGLASKEEVVKFFEENFPEISQLMPEEEAEAFYSRPVSSVLTVRCNRYHYGDSVLIIGDAAHAVSPSIGQGCNSALEDVLIFDNLLDEYSDNWANAIAQFTIRRQPDAHALMELSNNSFPLSRGLLIEFLLRESFAKFMHQLFPQRFSPSLFDLVFDSTVPYREILNSHKGWISKVKKSNEKFLAALV
ncbi:vioC monooxygenase [Nostocales cyanobacterium HT-58-2]|nr:vioC monooxygenase [Nostocales cyanobacterium HT-58-2]